MARINMSYYAILGIISIEPMSGYQMKAWVDEGVGYFLDMDYKQIYPTLERLVASGLVEYEIVKSGSRPQSKVYHLTDSGLEELKKWLSGPVHAGKQSVSELMLKMFFGHHISTDANLEHLKQFRASRMAVLESLNEVSECLDEEEPKDAFWRYRVATVNRGKLLNKAEIEWCNQTMEEIIDK